MEIEGSNKREHSNAQSLVAKEGPKTILNIREAHDQDKIEAKSQGIIINSESKIIKANNISNSRRDYLKVNTIDIDNLSELFDPTICFDLDKDAKVEDQAKFVASDPLSSIIKENLKSNTVGVNLSTNMTDHKTFSKSSTQQVDYKVELVAIDDGFNDFEIFTK